MTNSLTLNIEQDGWHMVLCTSYRQIFRIRIHSYDYIHLIVLVNRVHVLIHSLNFDLTTITTRWPRFNKLSKQTVWCLSSNVIRVWLNTDYRGNSAQLSYKYKTIQNYKAIESLLCFATDPLSDYAAPFSDVHSAGRGWQSPLQERNKIVGGAHDRDWKGRPCSEKREESHQSQNH